MKTGNNETVKRLPVYLLIAAALAGAASATANLLLSWLRGGIYIYNEDIIPYSRTVYFSAFSLAVCAIVCLCLAVWFAYRRQTWFCAAAAVLLAVFAAGFFAGLSLRETRLGTLISPVVVSSSRDSNTITVSASNADGPLELYVTDSELNLIKAGREYGSIVYESGSHGNLLLAIFEYN